MIDFLQYSLNGIMLGMLYAIVAVGFIVIYRGGRIFNFAQGEIVMLGAFLVMWCVFGLSLPTWLGLILGLGLTIGAVVLIERLTLRPLVGQPLFSLVMVTIALMLVLDGTCMAIWGATPTLFPAFLPKAPITVGPFIFAASSVWGSGIAVVTILGLWWFFRATPMGLSMSAVAEDHQVSRSLGINVGRSIMLAWIVSAVLSVIAAVVYITGRSVGPTVGEIGIRALPVAVFAGFESVPGALLAGAIVGIGEALANAYIDPLTEGGMSLVFPFILMLIVLLVRPYGLFGWERIERV